MKNYIFLTLLLLVGFFATNAQVKVLGLEEAIQAGVQNSKQLNLSQDKIDVALSKMEQTKDATWPSLKVSAGYSHALMLTQQFALPSSNGQSKSLSLPFDNSLYQGTISINEPIFNGNRFRYAKASSDLLVRMSKLDAEKDKEEVIYTIINSYINYYKILQGQKILAQNEHDIQSKLDEIKKFEKQGLATRNDVLRFELQNSNLQLTALDLEKNRQVANYNMNILLGFPDSTSLQLANPGYKLDLDSISDYVELALQNRKEFSSLKYQDQLADIDIKKVKDERLPTIGVGGNLYYINLSKNVVPKSGSYLTPFIVGINAGWDITALFQNKNKLQEANIKRKDVLNTSELLIDQVKMEVHESFLKYQTALNKLKLQETAITQAGENERITETKFHNNLASTTERIDAQTLLYEARIDLELAKADATIAYYDLLKSAGLIK